MSKLTSKEQQKYITIKEYVAGRINRKQAAIRLGIAPETVSALKAKYIKQGKAVFSHGNHGNHNANCIPNATKQKIVSLYKTKYSGFNFSHFYEMISSEESSESLLESSLDLAMPTERTVARILDHSKIVSPQANRHKRAPNQHPIRPRRSSFGELVQMDASLHDWLSTGNKITLHLAIDDATSQVLAAHFEDHETLHGYYVLSARILVEYGIPGAFYTDRRTVFEYMSGKRKQAEHIQFKQACSQLGIEIITTSIAQAKGRVERSFRTFQDRLVAELRLANIKTIDGANQYLPGYLIRHNRKFGLSTDIKNGFGTLNKSVDINKILCISTPRSILNGNVVSFHSQQLMPMKDNGQPLLLAVGIVVDVIQTLDSKLLVKYQDMYYDLVKVADGRLTAHIPPPNHPWKQGLPACKKYSKK